MIGDHFGDNFGGGDQTGESLDIWLRGERNRKRAELEQKQKAECDRLRAVLERILAEFTVTRDGAVVNAEAVLYRIKATVEEALK